MSLKASIYENLELSKLFNSLLVSNNPADFSKQLQKLKEKCSGKFSCAGLYILCKLVENGRMSLNQCISLMVSLVPSVGNQYSGLVQCIGQLIITHKFDENTNFFKQNPLVTILRHDWKNVWPAVYNFILVVLHEEQNMTILQKIDFLKPLFIYVFCNENVNGAKLNFLQQLLKYWNEPNVKIFIFDLLAYQQVDMDFCWILFEVTSINCNEDSSLLEVEVILLGKCLQFLINSGYDPTIWISTLKKLLHQTEISHSILLILLAETIQFCSASNIGSLTTLCQHIINYQKFNPISGYYLLSVLLAWIIFPSTHLTNLPRLISDISTKLLRHELKQETYKKLCENNFFKKIQHNDISFAVELMNILELDDANLKKWLQHISRLNNSRVHNLLSGLILSSSNSQIIDACLKIIIKNVKTNSFSTLCLLLHKLTRVNDPDMQLNFLNYLPETGVDKDNIQLIIGTLDNLTHVKSGCLQTIVISLYLKLWIIEKRTFPHFFNALVANKVDPTSNTYWEYQVTRAYAMLEICRNRPELHGKELVAPLSDILNHCGGLKSGLPSALALEAIAVLCHEKIIDIQGTWKALEPKLGDDKRSEIVKSLCHLFGLVPEFSYSENPESDLFKHSIIQRLWSIAMDPNLGNYALDALGKFHLDDFSIDTLPNSCKYGIKVPSEYQDCPVNELPYIPGECWIKLLDSLPQTLVFGYIKLIKSFLMNEVKNLPRGIYHNPTDTAEPLNYNILPYKSILRAIIDFLRKNEDDGKFKTLFTIISEDYIRLLPPLNWTFLKDSKFKLFNQFIVKICAQQGFQSLSARGIITNYIQSYDGLWPDEEILSVYNILEKVCISITPNILRPFIERTLNLSLDSALKKNDAKHFEIIMMAIKKTIALANVPESNRTVLILIVESIMESIPPGHMIIYSYAECVAEFPEKYLSKILSPVEKLLQNVICLRSCVFLRNKKDSPLICLNDCIDVACSLKKDHCGILRAVMDLVFKCKDHSSSKQWLIELRGRIQVSLNSNDSNATLFLLDIYIITAIILSNNDCLVEDLEELIMNRSLRLKLLPLSLYNIYNLSDWKIAQPQVIEWLYRLKRCPNMMEDYKTTFEYCLIMFKESPYLQQYSNLSRILFNA